MVRLFQVQLEHYEKVEGAALSLEGKANQLAQMVRQHLPLAMQGLAVVPLFAGYDTARGTGRIFNYDVTGGHYEDTDFQATGSGGRDARSTIKLGWREGLARDEAVDLAIQSLYEAADEDSATGGPDLVRGIYPIVAVSTPTGYREVPEDEVAERFGALIARRAGGACAAMSMPYYVAPEQVMKDRAEYAQKGIARGRSLVATTYDVGIAIVAENPSRIAAQDQRDLRPHRLRRRRQVQRVRPAPGGRRAPRRHQGLRLQPRGRRRPLAGQPLRAVPRQRLHPRDEAARGRDPGGRAGRRTAGPAVPHRLRGHDHRRGPLRRARRRRRDHHRARRRSVAGRLGPGQRPSRRPTAALAGPDRTLAAGDLEVAILSRGNGRRTFRRIDEEELAQLLA